ncbi:MAG: GNAT family N-acetyltransferase [Christensenellaceae bacterium]|nr:GNAT family N-acetyltransferase [Christensenellaceae bacterium]
MHQTQNPYNIRELKKEEYPLLKEYLYMSVYVPKGEEPFHLSIIYEPGIALYRDKFGELPNDYALCATIDNQVVGICWVRIIDGYGSIDKDTPEFAISIKSEYRGKGIGESLMQAMLKLLKSKGYKRASLSVQKENYAAKLYFKLGFEVYEDRENDYILVYNF